MVKGLADCANSLYSKMKDVSITANNLANVNTVGYKRELPLFEYMLRNANNELDSKKQLTDFAEGSFIQTGNRFDLAIQGDGFFVIETERGKELTRNGKFRVTEEGDVVTQDGNKLMGKSGSINIYEGVLEKDRNNITISEDGEIKAGEFELNKILIVKTEEDADLQRTEGQNFYSEDQDYVTAEEGEFQVRQGFLEEANINPVLELQNLIQTSKDSEAIQKLIGSIDTLMGYASKDVGKV
ncbi:MAG: flagellar hook basal-body protein [bacterium]